MIEPGSILEKIYFAHCRLRLLEESPREFVPGEILYASEIHAIVAVQAHEGCNLTELAGVLEISVPAAFKVAGKMVTRGYLDRRQKSGNSKEVTFWLTAKGRRAVARHEAFEDEVFGPLIAIEEALPEAERAIILSFLTQLKGALP